MSKLERCPICKGRPDYFEVGDFKECYIMRCEDCGYTAAKYGEGRFTKWGARNLWNRRIRQFIENLPRNEI